MESHKRLAMIYTQEFRPVFSDLHAIGLLCKPSPEKPTIIRFVLLMFPNYRQNTFCRQLIHGN
jgi:hypothetical protein